MACVTIYNSPKLPLFFWRGPRNLRIKVATTLMAPTKRKASTKDDGPSQRKKGRPSKTYGRADAVRMVSLHGELLRQSHRFYHRRQKYIHAVVTHKIIIFLCENIPANLLAN